MQLWGHVLRASAVPASRKPRCSRGATSTLPLAEGAAGPSRRAWSMKTGWSVAYSRNAPQRNPPHHPTARRLHRPRQRRVHCPRQHRQRRRQHHVQHSHPCVVLEGKRVSANCTLHTGLCWHTHISSARREPRSLEAVDSHTQMKHASSHPQVRAAACNTQPRVNKVATV